MDSKHTPGPWEIVARETMEDGSVYPAHIVGGVAKYGICYLESATVARLATENPGSWPVSGQFRNRNAHLIAAAPDLLDALQALLYVCENHADFRNGVTDPTGTLDEGNVIAGRYFQQARAAIAKATGQ